MTDAVLCEILNKSRGENYDVAVMYSGGKDSSYLLYLLKEVYKMRVVAVFVNNGYEHDKVFEVIDHFPKNLDIDFVTITPDVELFRKLYHTVITESDYFKRDKVNHVCFICNNILWCSVAEYAAMNNIPYIASGLSLAQLSSGRPYPLKPDRMANAIAERSTKQILKNAIRGFYETKAYHEDGAFRTFVDSLGTHVNSVTTVYPFIYHQVSVDELKRTVSGYGWTPPTKRTIDEYISSGCKIMSNVVLELEKLGIVTLNEREQAKTMVENGLISDDSMKYATYDASKDIVKVSNPIIEDIGIKDFLIEKCIEQNRIYE